MENIKMLNAAGQFAYKDNNKGQTVTVPIMI